METVEFVGGPRDGMQPFSRKLFDSMGDGYAYFVADSMTPEEIAATARLLSQPGPSYSDAPRLRRHLYIKRGGKFYYQGFGALPL